ncbi:hypothetical protein IV203_017619 [Nitzschia inconspicua]|uniref:Uncharacterized protein n=1 Tax=Nitzschia inconspicua TaxID=303405 RepID=A0A9K3K5P8_9STRA|nr:hypothetical protein IV203_017619 [Nitzschia inconspicua]
MFFHSMTRGKITTTAALLRRMGSASVLVTNPSVGCNIVQRKANESAAIASSGIDNPLRRSFPRNRQYPQQQQQQQFRSLSSSSSSDHHHEQLSPDDPQAQFRPSPPMELTLEMVRGIQQSNALILKYGVGKQRLQLLAESNDGNDMPLPLKWQRMMEIYLGAQLHVIASLGYETNEGGLMKYTQQLGTFIHKCPPDVQDEFRRVGRTTWRDMLVLAFGLDQSELPTEEMSIVDARNTVHKVASRLIEPAILEAVVTRVAALPPQSDPQTEMGLKHAIIQDVVVHQVYLGGDPPLVEELGFGSGPKGYATMQYVMAYHENDPLCMQYTSSSMVKIWQAAGLDLSNAPPAAVAKMPMSAPN